MPSPTDSLLDWARYYHALGFSIIPVHRSKAPKLVRWKQYQTTRPTLAEVESWFTGASAEDTGIAVILGPVSGNLFCYDVDDWAFVRDLRERAVPWLQQTWSVQSGSGKLHIYVQAKSGLDSSTINGPSGAHVVDLRGTKEYVVLPPSPHPSGGTYLTLYGSPETMARVDNAHDLIWKVYRRWSGRVADEEMYGDDAMYVEPPLPPQQAEEMKARILRELPQRARVAIFGTPGWRVLYPSQAGRSELQFGICFYLAKAGWDEHDVEALFATFPCGDLCYRRDGSVGYDDRPHHGHSHLVKDYRKAVRSLQVAAVATEDAQGLNFAISHVRTVDYGDEVRMDLTVRALEFERTRTLQLPMSDVWAEKVLLRAVSGKLGIFAQLPVHLSGKNYPVFLNRLMSMTEAEEVPEDIRTLGYTRGLITTVLIRTGAVKPYTVGSGPDLAREISFGWTRGSDLYLRSGKLINEVALLARPAPPPRNVWWSLREIGAEQESYQYPGDGSHELFWRLPQSALNLPVEERVNGVYH